MIILAILTRLIAADFQLSEAESLRLAKSLEEVHFKILTHIASEQGIGTKKLDLDNQI